MTTHDPPLDGPRGEAPTVLVVDDEEWNLVLVEAILEDPGYRVLTATSGPEAIRRVDEERPDLVLLDVMMPGMDGFEVCRRLKARRRTFFVPVLLLTALADVESKVRGLEAGADDFLNKPIDRIELRTRVETLLRVRALRDQLDQAEQVMIALVAALEGKDPARRGHSRRVAAIAGRLAEALDLPGDVRAAVGAAALLHDVGKVGVPEGVLTLPEASRSPEEERLHRRHPLLGAEILAPLASLSAARELVRHHHERLDGSGYPDGLVGDAFTPAMEVVALADRWETLVREDPSTAVGALRREAEEGRFRATAVEAVLGLPALPEPDEASTSLRLPLPPLPASGRVIVADGDPTRRGVLVRRLEEAGYATRFAPNAAALFEAVRRSPPDLVLVQSSLPGGGAEAACRRLKAEAEPRFLPVVVVGGDDPLARDRAIVAGADDVLSLPVNGQELVARVRSLLRLAVFHHDLEERENVVRALSRILDAKDPYTRGHSARVAELAVRMALEMGMSTDFAAGLRTGGLLHDIGKVAIPERLLDKPGRLTDEELSVVQRHPVLGREICRPLGSLHPFLPAIEHHHERWDGSGYPAGLAGEAIPLSARILGLVDAYDALTTERPYRAPISSTAAVELLEGEGRAGKWDPAVLATLRRLEERGALVVDSEPTPP